MMYVFSLLVLSIHCRPYSMESEIKVCRSSLQSEMVRVYVAGADYILMNDLTQSLSFHPQRGALSAQKTHVTRLPPSTLLGMKQLIKHAVSTYDNPQWGSPDGYSRSTPSSKTMALREEFYRQLLSNIFIPFMFGILITLLIMYMLL